MESGKRKVESEERGVRSEECSEEGSFRRNHVHVILRSPVTKNLAALLEAPFFRFFAALRMT